MTDHLYQVYNRAPVTPVRGHGAWLEAEDGRIYLDCVGGVACNALGHCHPALVAALTEQAAALWHVSNMYRIPGQEALAGRLTGASFADRVFFCNTGSEAVECAIKTARRHHAARGAPERIEVIGFAGSFHGRTYAALNAAGNTAYLDGFGPLMEGFRQLSLDDRAAVEAAAASRHAAAIIVEPVQGEGGARALSDETLLWLRRLCDRHGLMLIHDEVQCGMGRTGRLFAHQWVEGAAPDIMAVAKALGGGFPVGACLATEAAAAGMSAATHGSTFGGNPLAMAVAGAAFDIIADEATLAHARAVAEHLAEGLAALKARHPDLIAELRGKGLLIGLRMIPDNRAFMAAAREAGLLIGGGGDNVVRLLPPLNLTFAEADEVIGRLDRACAAMRAPVELAA